MKLSQRVVLSIFRIEVLRVEKDAEKKQFASIDQGQEQEKETLH